MLYRFVTWTYRYCHFRSSYEIDSLLNRRVSGWISLRFYAESAVPDITFSRCRRNSPTRPPFQPRSFTTRAVTSRRFTSLPTRRRRRTLYLDGYPDRKWRAAVGTSITRTSKTSREGKDWARRTRGGKWGRDDGGDGGRWRVEISTRKNCRYRLYNCT